MWAEIESDLPTVGKLLSKLTLHRFRTETSTVDISVLKPNGMKLVLGETPTVGNAPSKPTQAETVTETSTLAFQ